jgi:hypothetical protein
VPLLFKGISHWDAGTPAFKFSVTIGFWEKEEWKEKNARNKTKEYFIPLT